MKQTLTSIVFQGERFWVAKCAELGVTSQGITRDDALRNLREAVELFLEDSDVLPKKTSVASFEIEYAA